MLIAVVVMAVAGVPVVNAFAQTSTDTDSPAPTCPESEPVVKSSAPPPIAARVEGPAGVVALTFDAGADRGYAQDILDTLSEASIPATFGMTGRWAMANPELVQRMASDGHMVINHTFDHQSFTGRSDHLGGLSAEWRRYELLQADAIIAPLIGHTTCPWYRLPYFDGDRSVVGDVLPAGYTQQVGWTIDTLGWRGSPVQNIVDRSLRLAAPNAVYVMHVGIQSRDGPALPTIIEGLKEMGYGFATVATLD
ncbi:MAG: polysaccharide deacetylase family protein [Chloroflexota bacterium]|nr:polysaccharide deacetylase family protein [Chloroflexota bacterium]